MPRQKKKKPAAAPRKTSVPKKTTCRRDKVKYVMDEYKRGTLHSGSSSKRVTEREQAVAIALNEARRYCR